MSQRPVLLSRGPVTETLEEHVEKYGFLARTPGPTTPAQLEALGERVGMPLPAQLRDFYLRLGGLILGQLGFRTIALPSPSELMERLRLTDGWRRIASLGLVDMALASWGNDRHELRPHSGVFTAEELARANSELTCVGWIETSDAEGRVYVTFDRSGEVYFIQFHQDEIEDFQSAVRSVLRGETTPASLSRELVLYIDRMTEAIRELQSD